MNKNYYIPSLSNFHIKENKAWFITDFEGALFELDFNKKKLKFIDTLGGQKENIAYQNSACFFYNNLLYCFPHFGQYIWIYNFKTKTWRDIFIKELDNKIAGVMNYRYYEDNEELVVYICEQQSFLHFSLKDEKVTKCSFVSKNIDTDSPSVIMLQNKAYVVSPWSDKLYHYDILSGNIKEYPIKCYDSGFYTSCYNDNKIWLTGNNHFLYCLNNECKIMKTIPLPKEYGKNNAKLQKSEEDIPTHILGMFNKSIFLNNIVWLIPGMDNNLLLFDTLKNEWHEMELPNENDSYETIKARLYDTKYWFLYERDKRYFGIYSYKNDWILEIDTLTKTSDIISFDINDIPWNKILHNETNSKSLKLWLNKLLEKETINNNQNNKNNLENSAGKQIYQFVKGIKNKWN